MQERVIHHPDVQRIGTTPSAKVKPTSMAGLACSLFMDELIIEWLSTNYIIVVGYHVKLH